MKNKLRRFSRDLLQDFLLRGKRAQAAVDAAKRKRKR